MQQTKKIIKKGSKMDFDPSQFFKIINNLLGPGGLVLRICPDCGCQNLKFPGGIERITKPVKMKCRCGIYGNPNCSMNRAGGCFWENNLPPSALNYYTNFIAIFMILFSFFIHKLIHY